jgi:hypothetical protein
MIGYEKRILPHVAHRRFENVLVDNRLNDQIITYLIPHTTVNSFKSHFEVVVKQDIYSRSHGPMKAIRSESYRAE